MGEKERERIEKRVRERERERERERKRMERKENGSDKDARDSNRRLVSLSQYLVIFVYQP